MQSLVKKDPAKIYSPGYQNKVKKETTEEWKKDYVWKWLMNNDVSGLQELEEDGFVDYLMTVDGGDYGGWRAYGVVVSMFDFHRSDRGSNPGRGGKIS